jgi:competence protein ComEA
MDLLNRMGWIMGGLATAAVLAALGVGLNGYFNTPRADAHPAPEPGAAAAESRPGDPLAPRILDSTAPIRVHVAGAVKRPGVYQLPGWARVVDAMKKAGGATPLADLDAINLADRIRDGEQVRIPYRGRSERLRTHQPTPEPLSVPTHMGGVGNGRYPFAGGDAEEGPATQRLDLNSATREQLEALPGIGPSTADRILAYRQEHGRFLQVEDLLNVQGIGPGRFQNLRERVVVE